MKNSNNDNVISKIEINNDNENNDNDKYIKAKRVDTIADTLINKLHLGNGSRPFMCKVAWRLPEYKIWNNLETATNPKVTNPAGLFIYLCKRDGV